MTGDVEAKAHQGPLILMADDDEDDCMLATDAFKESNSAGTFLCVEDGVELLEYLSRSGKTGITETPLPAMILLDLNMPRKTGRQALTEIKSVPAFQNIPVVVLTTSREVEDVTLFRQMGAKDFITKPNLFSEWVAIIKSLVERWVHTR